MKISGLLTFALCALALVALTSAASAAVVTIEEFGTDRYRYLPGANITVSGKVLEDSSGKAGVGVDIRLYGPPRHKPVLVSSTSATTDAEGKFSATLVATERGRHYINASSSGAETPLLDIVVCSRDEMIRVESWFTTGTVYAVGLNETGYGNGTFDDTIYNFSVSPKDVVSVEVGGITTAGLVTNSRVKLGVHTYSILFVNRSSEIVLARTGAPVFSGVEGTVDLTLAKRK